jgi:hypothetical protein
LSSRRALEMFEGHFLRNIQASIVFCIEVDEDRWVIAAAKLLQCACLTGRAFDELRAG